MEKLNIKEFLSVKDSSSQFNKTTNLVKIDENGSNIYYKHEDYTTGQLITIEGAVKIGFKKFEFSNISDLATEKEFFGNGNLKSFKTIYVGLPRPDIERNQFPQLNFPVGISYEYNKKGSVVNEVDNEKYFKFTLDKIKKYLVKDWKMDFSEPDKFVVIYRYIQNSEGFWQLGFKDPTDRRQNIRLILSGNTGEKISERKSHPGYSMK